MISIDALYWQPGWLPSDPASFKHRMTEAANLPAWIMDGNYLSHEGKLRLALADTIFWFDLPRWVCMTGIFRRIVTTYGQVRPEMAPGCPERFDIEFIRYVWTYRQKQRPKQLAFFRELRPDQTLITFTRRRQADDYLAHRAAGLAIAGA